MSINFVGSIKLSKDEFDLDQDKFNKFIKDLENKIFDIRSFNFIGMPCLWDIHKNNLYPLNYKKDTVLNLNIYPSSYIHFLIKILKFINNYENEDKIEVNLSGINYNYDYGKEGVGCGTILVDYYNNLVIHNNNNKSHDLNHKKYWDSTTRSYTY